MLCVTVELPPQVGETETSKVLKLDQTNGDEGDENKGEKANNLNIEVSHNFPDTVEQFNTLVKTSHFQTPSSLRPPFAGQ